MPETSRAATMLAILKKQYEPEAEALEKTGHTPIEGKEFSKELKKRKHSDPDEWLKRKLEDHGITLEQALQKESPKEKLSQPENLMQPEKLPMPKIQYQSEIKPEVQIKQERPEMQVVQEKQEVQYQSEIPVQKKPELQKPEKRPLTGFFRKFSKKPKTRTEEKVQQELKPQLQVKSPQETPHEKRKLRGMLYRKLKRKDYVYPYPKFSIEKEKFSNIVSSEEVKEHHVVYPLIKPFAFASIKWDNTENAMIYSVVEPELTEEDKKILEILKEGLIQVINVSFDDIKNRGKMLDFLEESVRKFLYEYDFKLNEQQYMKIMYYIFRDFIGLNEIEPILHDSYIEDIGADGVGIPIYVVHQRYGSVKTNIVYNDEEKLKEFVTKLAERCDRYISYAEPLLDGSLPDGTRVHASLAADVTTRGPSFSIRKFRETPFSPVDIVKLNTASPELLAYLWFVVQNGANILITGGVSTGKTSFLNCLSLFIPPEAKVVSIEDTRELSLPHENWVPGVSRVGFSGSGVGEVSMFELLRESFRQNPDYLIVGEIRGKEAYVMFQAMASGHPSMCTMHAGSIDDVIKRLQTKPISLSAGLLESLDVVIVMVHAREKGKSARRVKEVVELQSIEVESNRARVTKSFSWLPAIDNFEYRGDSWVLHKISKEKGIPMDKIVKEISRRKKLINWMVENNVVDLTEVINQINLYYRNPEKLKDIVGP